MMTAARCFAYTLTELMVAMAVLSTVVLLLVSITNHTAQTWKYTAGKMEQFSSARDAFESLTRRAGQATLNTYYDYFDAAGQPRTLENAEVFTPKTYGRQSELRFICGSMSRSNLHLEAMFPALAMNAGRPRPAHGLFFHAPAGQVGDATKYGGLENLLNCMGYYVEFDSDERERPPFLKNAQVGPLRWRYRLMEWMQPAEELATYTQPDQWFQSALNHPDGTHIHALAENVIALIVTPVLSEKDEQTLAVPVEMPGTALAPNYFYDSTKKNAIPALNPHHQLPPNLRVTMVAIDEASALRLANGNALPDLGLENLFRTDTERSAHHYYQDLETLQKTLAEKRCSHRVFTTNIIIRGAKWSKQ